MLFFLSFFICLFRCEERNNLFGIGLVGQGDDNQINLAKELAGKDGWILLIFPGGIFFSRSQIQNFKQLDSQGPDPSWVNCLNHAWDNGLNVVIRLDPNWGNSHSRDDSDDDDHLVYTTLAQAYKRVVQGLPVRDKNLYLQIRKKKNIWLTREWKIENEPDLCYEWFCGKDEPGVIDFNNTIANEYAHFLNDVIDAIKSIGNPQYKVSLGALAPGGAIQCGCCGQQNCPDDKGGITGLQFLQAMQEHVPDIFKKVDFFTSHSYPAQGIGWGFNVPFDQAKPGLTYYQLELQTINRPDLPVLITETGWATNQEGLPKCTEEQKAQWTVQSYEMWYNDTTILGVMPFMLQDAYWGDKCGFGYVKVRGDKYPVFGQVHDLRCKYFPNSGGC